MQFSAIFSLAAIFSVAAADSGKLLIFPIPRTWEEKHMN